MFIVSYRSEGLWRAGVVRDSLLLDAASLNDSPMPATVRAILEAGPAVIDRLFERARDAFESKSAPAMPLADAELGPPVPDPDKIICLGLNYREHAIEFQMRTSEAPPIFAKFRNALCGPTSPIVLPRVSQQIDYEGELAVVIGRRCKEVTEGEALDYVGGYTIMNDVSARDLQMKSSQWTAGKVLDTFAPTGPWIVPASDIPDPQTLQIWTRVNGVTLQHGNTGEMIFSVARTIAFLSSLMTLVPGDIIATGTPAGVGFKRNPPIFLKAGDIVEVEIERIGIIANPVVEQWPADER